jgi:hypothetical protein
MTTNNTMTMARLVLAAGIALGVQARADEWDVGTDNDNGSSTDNVLFHGSEQTHDMAGLALGFLPDQDWYLTASRRFSSYQFVIDGMTGDLDLTSTGVQRLAFSDTTVIQSAVVSDAGGILSLNWLEDGIPNLSGNLNADAVIPTPYLIRVRGAACAAGCKNTDRYRARFYDTTYTVPRFNNSGTQTTVLVVQNASDRFCGATFFFLDSSGGLWNATSTGAVEPNGVFVLATATVVPDLTGSVRIAHTCGYGGLSGKAVSVEPATGFTFDTQMLHRPH